MLNQVEIVQTKITSTQIAQVFISAWISKFAATPRKESIAVLYAHNFIETGGNSSCFNFNLANVKAIDDGNPNTSIDYVQLHNVWEIEHGVKIMYQPPNPQTFFRAFPSLSEGVSFYIDFLRNNRYRIAWAAVLAGDPKQFATLLKKQGYYTAPVEQYIAAMTYQFNSFMRMHIYEDTITKLQSSDEPITQVHHPLPDPLENVVLFPDEDTAPAISGKPPSFIANIVSKIKSIFK